MGKRSRWVAAQRPEAGRGSGSRQRAERARAKASGPTVLLYLLASRNGRVVTREEILDAVWGTDFVAESNIVDRHIRSLRIKLQNDYRHPRFITTVPGRGYRFIPTFTNTGWGGESAGEDQPAG